MPSVCDRESERVKILLCGDISLQVHHFNDFMIPTTSGLIAENLGRIWGGGGGGVQGVKSNPLH